MSAKRQLTPAEALLRLRLFNEKAEKLLRCSFVENVFKQPTGITISFGENQPMTVERRGADEEATAALSLTLRFFFNQRDGISLDQIRDIYEILDIPDEQKKKARDAFGRFDNFLQSGIGVVFKGKRLTNWNIIETVLYGDLAHANDDKRPIFQEWRDAAPFGTMIDFYYEDAVSTVVQFIASCQRFNDKILQHEETTRSSSPG